MKQFLMLLSSIGTLTIASNNIININNTTINNFSNNKNNIEQKTLFNNKYKYLNNSNWITNQSAIDHKFYSYDTSVLAYYDFANAKNTFVVDSTGNLVVNPNVIILDKNKLNIANTKQEMVDKRKVTTIKDDYNPYSESSYVNNYFNGDNNDWKYLQMGGNEKQIDISQQPGASKVEYSNNLSENLGLYYIAKAARENKITQTVADNLGIYFISQTSLKGQISDNLTIKILELIIENNDIYHMISEAPMINGSTNLYKNYSTNYIFDNKNNLIKVYYNSWNKNNIENNLNYYWNDSYSWWNSDNSNQHTLLKWTDYAKDWDTFIKLYPNFNFNQSSLFLSGATQTHNEDAAESFSSKNTTNKILTDQGSGNTNSLYHLHVYMGHDTSQYPTDGYANLDLDLWHDNQNIYFKWFFTRSGDGTANITVKLANITFTNIMN